MKKVFFLMLFIIILGTVNANSQVRIGGNEQPNNAAVLDLNAAEGTNNGTKGLALPRVILSSNIATLDGQTANINGMLVYNTGGTLSAGVYYWTNGQWVNVADSYLLAGDTVSGKPAKGQVLEYDGSNWYPADTWELFGFEYLFMGLDEMPVGTWRREPFTYPEGCGEQNAWITAREWGGHLMISVGAGYIVVRKLDEWLDMKSVLVKFVCLKK